MTTTTSVILDGRVIETTTDHGDGTATVTRYDEAGEVTATTTVPAPDAPIDPLEGLDPVAMRAAVVAGALLVSQAGALWAAFLEIAESNTAKEAIGIVTDVALRAALDSEPS